MVPSDSFHSQLPSHLQQGKEQGLGAASPFPRWLCQAASIGSRLPVLGLSEHKSIERLCFSTPPLTFRNSGPHPSRELASSPDSHQLPQPRYLSTGCRWLIQELFCRPDPSHLRYLQSGALKFRILFLKVVFKWRRTFPLGLGARLATGSAVQGNAW